MKFIIVLSRHPDTDDCMATTADMEVMTRGTSFTAPMVRIKV